MNVCSSTRWKTTILCLFLSAAVDRVSVFSQTASGTPLPINSSQNQAAVQTYQKAEQELIQERQALVARGATPQQLQAWHQQNAAQFAALQQMVQSMAVASALQPRPTNQQPYIPANASGTLKDFLTAQATLANARAQIHNQLIQAMPYNASAAQIGQMAQQERQIFQQEHAGDIQAQAHRVQTLATESDPIPIVILPPLVIRADATPQMVSFLTQRYQLMQDQAQLKNQYAGASPSVRQKALQEWRQQNAVRVQQVRQLAQELAETGPSNKK